MSLLQPLSTPITTETVRRQLTGRKVDPWGAVFRTGLLLALVFTIAILGALLITVVADSWSVITTRLDSFLSSGLRSQADEAGVFQGLRGTLWIGVAVVALAFPIGIGAAIYL
jgi:ABC-type phosphate transport system permease subunit